MSEIVCTMPGCQTTAGCLCSNRAGMTAWRDQIAKDALILNIANPSYAAGRLAGLREAAERVRALAPGETCGDSLWEGGFETARDQAVSTILALAEGG